MTAGQGRGLARNGKPAWQASTAGVPRVGGTADPDQDLVQMLAMDASSVDYRARQVIGEDAFWNISTFLAGRPPTETWSEHFARRGLPAPRGT